MITILTKIIVFFVYSVTFKCIWKWLCGTEKYLGSCVSGPIKAHECLYIRIGIKTKIQDASTLCDWLLFMPCEKVWTVNTFQRLYAVLCMCLQVVLFFSACQNTLMYLFIIRNGVKIKQGLGKKGIKIMLQKIQDGGKKFPCTSSCF